MTEDLLDVVGALDFDADNSDFLTEQMLDLTEDDLFDLHIPDLETTTVEDENDQDVEDDDDDEMYYDLELEATLFFTDEHQFSNTELGSSFKDILASSPGFVKYDPNVLCLSKSPANRQSTLNKPMNMMTTIPNGVILPDSACTSSCDSSDFLASIHSPGDNSNFRSDGFHASNNNINHTNTDVINQPLNKFTIEDMARLSSALANVGLDLLKEMNDHRQPKERTGMSSTSRVSLLEQQQRPMKKGKQSKGVSLLAKPPSSSSPTLKLPKKELRFKPKKSSGNVYSRKRWLVYRDHDYCSQVSLLAQL